MARTSTAIATAPITDVVADEPAAPVPRREVYDRMFTVTFDEAAERLAENVRTLTAMRLFAVLPRYLSYHEWRRLDQRTVAAKLKTGQGNVSKGLAELLVLGVVEKQMNGRNIEWRLSPDYGWRGDVASYKAASNRRKVFPPAPPTAPSKVAEAILWKVTLPASHRLMVL